MVPESGLISSSRQTSLHLDPVAIWDVGLASVPGLEFAHERGDLLLEALSSSWTFPGRPGHVWFSMLALGCAFEAVAPPTFSGSPVCPSLTSATSPYPLVPTCRGARAASSATLRRHPNLAPHPTPVPLSLVLKPRAGRVCARPPAPPSLCSFAFWFLLWPLLHVPPTQEHACLQGKWVLGPEWSRLVKM